ncbi:hypothetical protein B0H65DRAFT_508797 [Neurospora tetraspora]|uniref:Uncharacterized protein n=1 Tax=Neurospora tetraspora TaxID=94610 RepID=A0AAE0MRI3_9PEZI|nr:hypothetical protein B0H65DRAFT_508797 [Neurospora tetraspora]
MDFGLLRDPFASPRNYHRARAVNYTVRLVFVPCFLDTQHCLGLKLPWLLMDVERTMGPFFQLEFTQDNNEHLMRVVFRHQFLRSVMQSDESDSMGQSAELALTYTFDRNETTALFRISMGTTDFMPMYIANCIDQFGNFASKVPHPFALPYVMIRHLISKLNEENSFAMSIIEDQELVLACNSRGVSAATAGNYLYADTDTSVWNFRRMGRDWADIRRKVVSMLGSAETIGKLVRGFKVEAARLDSVESFARELQQRMQILESLIHLMTAEVSQRNGQLNMATAKWQINLTQASIRDAQTMKGLSFMGALFLPGTFLSTIFSMPFFEFNIEKLCIYFAAAIPLTALVIAAWVVWEQIQQRRMTDEQHGMEREIQKLENDAEGASRINHSISFTMKRAQQI